MARVQDFEDLYGTKSTDHLDRIERLLVRIADALERAAAAHEAENERDARYEMSDSLQDGLDKRMGH